jgi:hypothetical protein
MSNEDCWPRLKEDDQISRIFGAFVMQIRSLVVRIRGQKEIPDTNDIAGGAPESHVRSYRLACHFR